MKVIATYGTEFEARKDLEFMGFREIKRHREGYVYLSRETFQFVLLRCWNRCWEVQEPEAHNPE